QKAGIAPADLPDFLARMRSDYGFQIEGLMCIPPVEEPAGLHFALLAKLARENDVPRLSMGMSSDYETAIRLGATSVRVGTAFFGERES
ncbi:MAG: alanine racemase, partial [Alphaproteobacteria bacterium]|nr:alanine racemase [Alphaproteobacteria bacterium]